MDKRLRFPVDSANFKWIRENDYIYVDKTENIDSLTKEGKYYFLVRPRRFGKSLLLDTMAEYFRGNKKLFNGLAITHLQPNEWKTFPVLHFNLSGRAYLEPDSLTNDLKTQLENLEKEYGVENPDKGSDVDGRFHQLILNLKTKTPNNAVILIDEYDAPLVSTIDKPELQKLYREQLHGFYSILKKAEANIRFCMLTGVTRYGKVSVFSGLNNLKDISFSDKYATICGITKDELSRFYSEGVVKMAQIKGLTVEETYELLRFNYDGYHFSKSLIDIYNPFSINNAIQEFEIKDYWCRSGVPTILSKSLMHNDFDVESLNGEKVQESELTELSMGRLEPVPLFYQTGYLTIKAVDTKRNRFVLGYPNREVESGILQNILKVYMPEDKGSKQGYIYDMEDALENGQPEIFIKIMKSFLSGIPVNLHKYVGKYENYYHTIFYCMTTLIGLDVDAEYSTSEGFIDILIKTDKYIYIIELKINGTAEDAVRQIESKHYSAPFESDPRKLFMIGIGFSGKTHTIESSKVL